MFPVEIDLPHPPEQGLLQGAPEQGLFQGARGCFPWRLIYLTPMSRAYFRGLGVFSVEIDLPHPHEQSLFQGAGGVFRGD